MSKLNFYSYNNFSEGMRVLQKYIQDKTGVATPVIRHQGSNFRGNELKSVVNWGASELPAEVRKCLVYNTGEAVAKASNKLKFFLDMSPDRHRGFPRVVPWTVDKRAATKWMEAGHKIFARTLLTGHSGHGIVIYEGNQIIKDAPLYTLYIPKKEEYRVHFFGGKIIDTQKKVLKKHDAAGNPIEPKAVNWLIRNLDNGFVYARENLVIPKDVTFQARRVMDCTSLAFGAIDIVFSEKTQQASVLEVNTAPGLSGTTVESYGDRIMELFGLPG